MKCQAQVRGSAPLKLIAERRRIGSDEPSHKPRRCRSRQGRPLLQFGVRVEDRPQLRRVRGRDDGQFGPIYLVVKAAGTRASPTTSQRRSYERHWTPVHLDFVVEEIEPVVEKAIAGGAQLEKPIATLQWGRLALMADPFGHGFCFVQFLGEGMAKSQSEPDAAPPNKTLPATCFLPRYAAELRRQPACFLAASQGGGQILKRTDTIGSCRGTSARRNCCDGRTR